MNPTALFFNLPAHGHVNPSLPLVAELTRRGHRITYFITEGYRDKVEAAGAKVQIYAGLTDDFFDPLTSAFHPQITTCELLKTTRAMLPELLETARAADPDYILFDCMCPWGYFVARILKIPAVSSFSLMPPIPRAFFNRSTLKFMLPMVFRDFRKGIEANRRSRALGKQYGVPPLGQINLLSAEGDLSISYSSREYVPFSQNAPASFRFVGRELEEEPDIDPTLFARVGDRPLIYVSMGTAFNQDRSVMETLLAAFKERQEYFLITTGKRFNPDAFGALPDNIAIHPWLPQIAVLKRASLFITHGGLNSVHDGLYFGVPLLLCPQQEEQTLNASRVVDLGAGLMLRRKEITVRKVQNAANRLLSEVRFKTRAGAIGETFRQAGGVARAADEIESLLKRHAR